MPELANKEVIEVKSPWTISALADGMKSGNPSVAVIIDLSGGVVVFAETSLKLFLTAADALKARHGDPRT